jgi:hypothetical protein
MTNSEALGIGLYSIVEASRLLKTPRRTLSRWVEGYVQELRGEKKGYAPLLHPDEERTFLTFGDLVDLMYVRGFRDAGVGLNELRCAAARYRSEWDVSYPLATKRFATDGKRLLIEQGGQWKHALTGQQQAFFDEIGKQLVHLGDLASEWRPLGNNRSVVLNPKRAFGKPIENASGAHTYVLYQALETEHDAAKVAWWYGTTESAVDDAAEFERFHSGRIRGGEEIASAKHSLQRELESFTFEVVASKNPFSQTLLG